MDITKIQDFAITARRKLLADIEYRCGLIGITSNGVAEPSVKEKGMESYAVVGGGLNTLYGKDIENRNKIIQLIKEKGFIQFVEETAYTWFNRIIAIRFMEVNDYLPTKTRVLSSETPGKTEPDIVTEALHVDLGFSEKQLDYIAACKRDNKADELYRFLFLRQCNKLGEILPELFERIDDYTELLLGISYVDPDGVIHDLLGITEDDFNVDKGGQVEIIGWLYQYYISEKHNEVVDPLHGKTIKKEDIPAATQLFTPDWIVRYMVDNSLGRYWLERHPDSKLRERLTYLLLPENGQLPQINEQVDPTHITFLDPCMGSGHILVYAYEIFMEIYKECGYTERDAAVSIVQNNLFGLDIDDRAAQLAYFALMMKARSFDRRFFSREIIPNVCAIQESNSINGFTLEKVTTDRGLNSIGEYLYQAFHDAKEMGSLLTIKNENYDSLLSYVNAVEKEGAIDLFSTEWSGKAPLFRQLAKQAKIMARKYNVVATNPPYFNKMGGKLKDFVIDNYKDYSSDLFSVFVYRNLQFCIQNGYCAYLTPNVWMSIKSYEELRRFIIEQKSILSLIQLAHNSFNEIACVDVCAFVLSNSNSYKVGAYIRLSDFKGDLAVQRDKVLEALNSVQCDYMYFVNSSSLDKAPGCPISAYWAGDKMLDVYSRATLLNDIASPKPGLQTGCNEDFLRLWFEVQFEKINFSATDIKSAQDSGLKWFPYNKGGDYRKWFGNEDFIVNWENNGFEIRNFKDENGKLRSRPQNTQYYFKECISWSLISSYTIAFRYKAVGHIFDIAGMSCFPSSKVPLYYLLALNNSCLIGRFMSILAPTINYQAGNIANIPVIYDKPRSDKICSLAEENIQLTRDDWNLYETSWEFKRNPLIMFRGNSSSLREIYTAYVQYTSDRFSKLKENEEELNSIFIDIYGLKGEIKSDVSLRDVSMTSIYNDSTVIPNDLIESYYIRTRKEVVRDFISYAVGCIFGRYSLDHEGLIYAGGEWSGNLYKSFAADADNILPITDEEYFPDDITTRFAKFVRSVFGTESLENNLDFIAEALGGNGDSSRETIRNYFLKEFFADHLKIYQKRPIYWLFDSGKQNGFKALIYMHRYDRDTVARVRTDYLHRLQAAYESAITMCENTIAGSASASDKARAVKRKDKLVKQLAETRMYDQAIAHVANQRIKIDLDDGIKHNYELFQGVEVVSTGKKAQKIDLLSKIK